MNNVGMFGPFGGQEVPEALKMVLDDLAHAFEEAIEDDTFIAEFQAFLKDYVGRKNPLYHAKRLSKKANGAQIYLKREDLNHTGAHKINNALGQALLAKRMGKKRVIAETGAGQHGVATATVCALLGMDCTIYMGSVDVKRQALNVFRMEMLGAKVVSVTTGTQTLKDAVDEALMDYMSTANETFYLLGSAVGPHPFPTMVRYFQSVIGIEARKQILEKTQKLPKAVIACVGGGSNAIGLFHAFMPDQEVTKIGVEPAGKGLVTNEHAATLTLGTPGVIHGFKCIVLQDENGQPLPVHSIAAGLDYPGVGPEHSYFKITNQARYESITDAEALEAFYTLSRYEGIIPALESAHAIAYALKIASSYSPEDAIIINLSGRGDKDVEQVKNAHTGGF